MLTISMEEILAGLAIWFRNALWHLLRGLFWWKFRASPAQKCYASMAILSALLKFVVLLVESKFITRGSRLFNWLVNLIDRYVASLRAWELRVRGESQVCTH